MQAILLGLVAFFGKCDLALGTSMLGKPLVLGTLTGLVMGDVTEGIIIGASLELVFIGAQSIGAFIPPNVIVGSVLGTAFAISTGKGPEVAVTLAYPIALLAVIIDNFVFTVIRPLFANLADKKAAEGNAKAVNVIHMGVGFLTCAILAILVAVGFSVGSTQIETLVNAIPEQITTGLTIATGILPALGFAMLAQMIMTKKVIPFFILGFLLSSYIGVPVVGIALFGLIAAILVTTFSSKDNSSKGDEGSMIDDEF